MDIIMIRHGESEDNVARIFSNDDTCLTDRGKSQILMTKSKLDHFNFETIYYSPLKRTVETLEHLGLTGLEEMSIQEINFGIFTGKTFEEISEIYPLETRSWLDDTQNYEVPQGESLLQVYERVRSFLQELSKHDKNILLVTHDCVIRLALCWIFDNPEYFFKFKVDNGSINIITIDDGFKFIKKLNV